MLPYTRRAWWPAQSELEVTLSFILAPVSFLFLWTALPACPRVVMASYLNPDAPKDSQDLWEEGEEVEKVKC